MGRALKSIAMVALAAFIMVNLTACSSRSVDAYCGVIDKHKDRYLKAMDEANSSGNILQGLAGMISALGDINRMWEEAAKVSPDEIQADVEAVRDSWAKQEETAKEMSSNPLKGLASGLLAGLMNSGPITRVDTYTAQNCPSAGAMFVAAAPSSTAPAPSSFSPSTPDTVIDGDDQSETSSGYIGALDLKSGWEPFGPLMRNGSLNDSILEIYDPATEVSMVLDAEQLLPDEEVTDYSYTYSSDGEDPIVVGMFRIRTPASGLNPEKYTWSIARISISDSPSIEDRFEAGDRYSDSFYNSEFIGAPTDGIVLIGPNNAGEITAVDVIGSKILWTQNGELLSPYGSKYPILKKEMDEVACGDYDETRHYIDVLNPVTGKTQQAFGKGGKPCLDAYHDNNLYYDNYFEYSAVGGDSDGVFIYDLSTQKTTDIQFSASVQDAVLPLVWGQEYAQIDDEGEPNYGVFDLRTGKSTFSITADEVSSLNLQLVKIFDGLLYFETTDEQIIVDAMTGDELGPWERYPSKVVGDYVWMSDSTLEKDWKDPALP